jgi:hypothetical protein
MVHCMQSVFQYTWQLAGWLDGWMDGAQATDGIC